MGTGSRKCVGVPQHDKLRSNSQHRGFTIVETVLSMLLVGLLLVPAVQAIGAAAKARGLRSTQRQGAELATQLLTEIMQLYYTLPAGTTDGSTRQTWVVVSDFNGYSENPAASRSGVALTGYTGWRRGVVVDFVDPANPSGPVVFTDMGMRKITVVVTSPSGIITTLQGLRSAYGASDRDPPTQTNVLSWIDVAIDGGGTAKAESSVNLVNQVP